jgi:hypothetical protein
MDHEIPEPEDFEAKEVFTFFGLAYYQAQVLEQQFVSFAAMLHVTGKTGITRGFVEQLFQKLESKTLGYLLYEARRLAAFAPPVDQLLGHALEKRNYLAHHFFALHDADFMLERGRQLMIDELRTVTAVFLDASAELKNIQMPLAARFGITDTVIATIMHEEIDKAREKFGA